MKKMLTVIATFLLLAAPATSAFADPAYQTSEPQGSSYTVQFVDDILNAPDGGSTAPLIKVRPPTGRATLIRPRLQFVTELTKTVENL